MKTLNTYINEKLVLNKNTFKGPKYKYSPKTKHELRKLLEELLDERGKDADLNDIDVSNITNMYYDDFSFTKEGLFEGLDPHNIDISLWNVSNVRVMYCMFDGCENFNCDLSSWDVSQVANMSHIFNNCKNFEGNGLERWNVSQVKDMADMFHGCENFNCDLSSWNVSEVDNMYYMFKGCIKFDCDLSSWNVSEVINMRSMFEGCEKFSEENFSRIMEKWDFNKRCLKTGLIDSCPQLAKVKEKYGL